ncbi:MAG: arsenite methyltransferase [Bacillota bacterium]
MNDQPDCLKEAVREKYAGLARLAREQGKGICCAPAGSTAGFCCAENYNAGEVAGLPPELLAASLGCGNPIALAGLQPGEAVLDLGSGAGLDVLLAARRVGPAGKVYGLDMTDEMLALAREHQKRSGLTNVEFIKGDMENIPLPENHVDVVISNCVINLAADKAGVIREAFRVLKPWGRLAISDMVWQREVPAWLRQNVELWAGCVAGALTAEEYRRLLAEAGFAEIGLEVTRVFSRADLPEGVLTEEMEKQLAPYAGSLVSAFVRARKPGGEGGGGAC